jgi:hypothetical protein
MHARTGGQGAGSWPEGLSDEEAIQRLQTLCLGACDGVQDLADDARYKALRRALIARADLRPLAPAFIAAQANLPAVVRHVREIQDRTQRRNVVRAQFNALREAVPGFGPTVSSSSWTGRPTRAQQAELILSLAPQALAAVEQLIDEEERRRGNGGPVEPDRQAALLCLRQFHTAIGELILLAESGASLEGARSRLKAIRQAAVETTGRAAAALPVTSSALTAFGVIVGLTDLLTGDLVVSVAAGAIAGNTVKDAMMRKEEKSDAA